MTPLPTPSNLPLEAPVFYPTEAEWQENPLSYLERVVRPYGEKTGIVKIVPPSKWRPPFSVEAKKFKFNTRQQHTNLLEAHSRISHLFDQTLRKRCYLQGSPMPRRDVSRYPPDYYALYSVVMDIVTHTAHEKDESLWIKVHEKIVELSPNAPFRYQYFADLPWEEVKRLYVTYVEAQLNSSSSGLRDHQSVPVELDLLKSTHKGMDGAIWGVRAVEAGLRASQLATTALLQVDKVESNQQLVVVDGYEEKDDNATTPYSGAGVTVESTLAMFSALPPKPKSGDQFYKYFPEEDQVFFGTVMGLFDRKNHTFKVRYQHCQSSHVLFEREEDEDTLALAVCAGGTKEEAKQALLVGVCQVCNRANDVLKLCSGCDFRFHDRCLLVQDRSQHESDKVDWFCPLCLDHVQIQPGEEEEEELREEMHLQVLRSESKFQQEQHQQDFRLAEMIGLKELSEFGFPDGDSFTLPEYIAFDQQFRAKYSSPQCFSSETLLEEEFWKIAKGETHSQIHVQYGNDLDTLQLGSGFPTVARLERLGRRMNLSQKRELDFYARSQWNLNNLPTSEGSLLQLVEGNISGVIIPWLYMGMTFSAFCYHVEDHNFASINYHHQGAPKSWWGVPAHGADAFEHVCQHSLGKELFQGRPDLLQGIVTMFDPKELCSHRVPVFHCIQRAGEFVVTFPRAYHGGFNHGWNSAEAVNFAGRGWLNFGEQAVSRYALLRKMPVVSHESLMLSIAFYVLKQTDSMDALRTAQKLLRPLVKMISQERQSRAEVELQAFTPIRWHTAVVVAVDDSRAETKRLAMTTTETDNNGGHSTMMNRLEKLQRAFRGVPQCSVCKRYCALSHAVIHDRQFCLFHAPHKDAAFYQNVDLELLEATQIRLMERVRMLEQWMERANRLVRNQPLPEEEGGLPFSVGWESREEDFAFCRINEWKHKPDMHSVRALLETLPCFLDEALVLQKALDMCETYCVRVLDTTTCKSLAEWDMLYTALPSLPLVIPMELENHVKETLTRAKEWQTRAQHALAHKEDCLSLKTEWTASIRVDMPEHDEMQSRDRVFQLAQKEALIASVRNLEHSTTMTTTTLTELLHQAHALKETETWSYLTQLQHQVNTVAMSALNACFPEGNAEAFVTKQESALKSTACMGWPCCLSTRNEVCAAQSLPRFCYCRTDTEDLFMAQCESCLEWFHSECTGFSCDKDMEALDHFYCLKCCTDKHQPYVIPNFAELHSKDLACPHCHVLCALSSNRLPCRDCHRTFHTECLTTVQRCVLCSVAKAKPLIMCPTKFTFPLRLQRMHAFLKQLETTRPLLSSLESVQRQHWYVKFCPPWNRLVALMDRTREWKNTVEMQSRQTCKDCSALDWQELVGEMELWEWVEEYVRLPFSLQGGEVNLLFQELVYRHILDHPLSILSSADKELLVSAVARKTEHSCARVKKELEMLHIA